MIVRSNSRHRPKKTAVFTELMRDPDISRLSENIKRKDGTIKVNLPTHS